MLTKEQVSLIESHYSLGKIFETSKLEGGYWNQTLKIETEKGKFVVRISRPRTNPESIESQHQLMRFMHARIPEVPLPILGRNSSTFLIHEDRIVSLLPFIDGQMASRKNPAYQISAAEMLGKLHRAALEYPESFERPGYSPLSRFNWLENNNWGWDEVENLLKSGTATLQKTLPYPINKQVFNCLKEIVSRQKQIKDEFTLARQWLEQLKKTDRQLALSAIHGDFYPGNLLVQDDKITAVLDWDECQSEWLACELGRSMWEFCRDQNEAKIKTEYSNAFLKAYQKAQGVVPPSEFDLLENFIRCIRVQEVLFSLGEALKGEFWDPEYMFYNLEALDNIKEGNLFF